MKFLTGLLSVACLAAACSAAELRPLPWSERLNTASAASGVRAFCSHSSLTTFCASLKGNLMPRVEIMWRISMMTTSGGSFCCSTHS